MSRTTYISAVLCALLLFPAMAGAEETPVPGSIEALRHSEANELMASGEFERARSLYYLLLLANQNDVLAQREAGRASHAGQHCGKRGQDLLRPLRRGIDLLPQPRRLLGTDAAGDAASTSGSLDATPVLWLGLWSVGSVGACSSVAAQQSSKAKSSWPIRVTIPRDETAFSSRAPIWRTSRSPVA